MPCGQKGEDGSYGERWSCLPDKLRLLTFTLREIVTTRVYDFSFNRITLLLGWKSRLSVARAEVGRLVTKAFRNL